MRARRFQREELDDKLPPDVFAGIVRETTALLERRFNSLAIGFDNLAQTNFNPFLLLITAPVYNIFSPFEVAERRQLGKAFHGDDTAFGRFGEEKLLPQFGASPIPEKLQHGARWEPVDNQIEIGGRRFLFSIKSGPWTMNQSHANAMIEKLPQIHADCDCPIVLGIMYGRYNQLNNKPLLVDSRLGGPDWFDYLVGRDFWEFVSGVKDVHKEIYRAIREAQLQFANAHRDETFQEKLVGNRIKIAASIRKEFNVAEEADFWETLFNNMF